MSFDLINFKQEEIPVTFSQLLELCSYQQEILQKYEEYIEQQIISKILEEDFDSDWHNPMGQGCFKRITIPQSTLMIKCDPSTLKAWEWLKFQRPAFEPEFYINAAFIEEGVNNVKTN